MFGFPGVDIHSSFLFSVPLLPPRGLLWSWWWFGRPWPATSFMGQHLWGLSLSTITGAQCGLLPPHATGHLSRFSFSLIRTRAPHQPGHCLRTWLCPNMAALETGTFSLLRARWRFRFPILFRDRSLLHTTQHAFLLYLTTCLSLHSISCLLHPPSAFCRCSPTIFRVCVDHVLATDLERQQEETEPEGHFSPPEIRKMVLQASLPSGTAS